MTIGANLPGNNNLGGTSAGISLSYEYGMDIRSVDGSGNIYLANQEYGVVHSIKKYSSTGAWLMTL